MKKYVDIKVFPHELDNEDFIKKKLSDKIKAQKFDYRLDKRSIDARGRNPIYVLRYEVFINEAIMVEPTYLSTLDQLTTRPKVIIVGAGPAGYFAALTLIQKGYKPVVLERGKDVRARRRYLRAIQQEGIVNPHSNYCFGEGGAGTYSDGKLYTRSHKRGKIAEILKILVEHGATTDILVDAHPHIGSNKLPHIVSAIRETIERFGGEVHFDSFVTDLKIKDGKLYGVVVNNEVEFLAEATILATGHSARDIYYLLDRHGVALEKKSFALGVRIEHPQPLIDEIQYGQRNREENLPASSYRLACQVDDKGVFSFCMCPGGLIVPASTAPEELVVNGMSLSRRDSPYANSGFVTAIDIDEMEERGYKGLWAHLEFQKMVESTMFKAGDGTQAAPAQRITDFVKNRVSTSLPESSYIPGVYSAPMHTLLPDFVAHRLKKALKIFGKKMKGYYTEEAQVIGAESRTSSPIKIPRNPDTFMHNGLIGFFPCGEGAGYAGGILSAAMDGQNVAKAVISFLE